MRGRGEQGGEPLRYWKIPLTPDRDWRGILKGEKGEFKLNLPLSLLPEGCKEGDELNISIERDSAATDQAKERISSRMERLKKKGQGKTGMIKGP